MTSRTRTTTEKTTDWAGAFNIISATITPQQLRSMLGEFNNVMATMSDPNEALALLQQSMALARLISANDRAAAIAAAMLTQSGGVSRPVLEEVE